MPTIDYYFSSSSPFTYLGNKKIHEVALAHGCEINYKPVNVFEIWKVSGAVPPAQRPEVRQRLRLIELKRLSEFRDLPINRQPKFFPVDPTLADSCIIAVLKAGGNPQVLMQNIFESVWVREADIADETVIQDLLNSAGFDGSAVIAASKEDDIAAERNQNSADAVAASAPGVPAYVLDGECFWGQDRIELLEFAIKTGRDPILS